MTTATLPATDPSAPSVVILDGDEGPLEPWCKLRRPCGRHLRIGERDLLDYSRVQRAAAIAGLRFTWPALEELTGTKMRSRWCSLVAGLMADFMERG